MLGKKIRIDLENRYRDLEIDELLQIASATASEYDPETIEIATAELKKRNVSEDEIVKFSVAHKAAEVEEKKKTEIPFAWGKFVIFMGFFQGSIAFIFGGMFGVKTEYLPNRIYSIILGLALLSYAYGLMKRMRWGLSILMVILYITIPLCILSFISGIFKGSIQSIIQGIGGGIVTFLNIIYFRKRKIMFK